MYFDEGSIFCCPNGEQTAVVKMIVVEDYRMKVFICGGGSGKQTSGALHRLNEVINHALPCLYIPLAMEESQYNSCYEWITGELSDVEIPGIEMVRSAEELSRKNLADYSFLFIGGGNTFKLKCR